MRVSPLSDIRRVSNATVKMSGNNYSTTALKRWSCQDKHLPELDKIRAIHVYDFDNTRA